MEGRIQSEADSFRTRLRVNRLHYTYVIRTPDAFREEYSYLFSGHQELRGLPLWWHSRTVQANMVATDADGCRVPILPSSVSREYSAALLEGLTENFLAKLVEPERSEVADRLRDVEPLLSFVVSEADQKKVSLAIGTLRAKFDLVPEFRRLAQFVTHLERSYLPIVAAPHSVSGDYLEIRQGVDLNTPFASRPGGKRIFDHHTKPGFWGWFRFVSVGSIEFSLKVPIDTLSDPPWLATDSLHLQLTIPAGMGVHRRPEALPVELFEGTAVNRFTSVSADYVYAYLTADEGKVVRRRFEELQLARDRAKDKFERNSRAARAPRPRVPSSARTAEGLAAPAQAKTLIGPLEIPRNFLYYSRLDRKLTDASQPRISAKAVVDNGVRLLGSMLWVVVGLTYAIQILGLLTVEGYIELFAAFLVVVLTLAIYSLDKPFIRYPVLNHVGASTIVFFELGALAKYAPWLVELVHRV
jgi:hypothetical protein